MIRGLLLVVALGVAGVVAYEHGRRISEPGIHAQVAGALDAMARHDYAAFCKAMAKDYRLVSIDHVGDVTERSVLDRTEACRQIEESGALLQALHTQTGGLFAPDYAVQITGITIAPGGRSAMVESTVTVKIGGVLMARTRSKERISRWFWQYRNDGGEARSWIYAG